MKRPNTVEGVEKALIEDLIFPEMAVIVNVGPDHLRYWRVGERTFLAKKAGSFPNPGEQVVMFRDEYGSPEQAAKALKEHLGYVGLEIKEVLVV